MLNTLISLGLESVGKRISQPLSSATSQSSPNPLGAYPMLHTALLRAERRGALDIERRKLALRRSAASTWQG